MADLTKEDPNVVVDPEDGHAMPYDGPPRRETPPADATPPPAPPAPPQTVRININGVPYDVTPEVAANYAAEVQRREAAARASATQATAPQPLEDDALPEVDYGLIYTDPDRFKRQQDARSEAIAERKARELEDAIIQKDEAEAAEAQRAAAWSKVVDRFYSENPDLDSEPVRAIVRTVWRENQTELGPLAVTPGLKRLSELTRGYLQQLGYTPGGAPKLASSRGAAGSPPPRKPADDGPETLGDIIRSRQAAIRKGA